MQRKPLYKTASIIIAATHGPRPVIKNYGGWHGRRTDSDAACLAGMERMFESQSAAFAWDRKVRALTLAIAGERRVIA